MHNYTYVHHRARVLVLPSSCVALKQLNQLSLHYLIAHFVIHYLFWDKLHDAELLQRLETVSLSESDSWVVTLCYIYSAECSSYTLKLQVSFNLKFYHHKISLNITDIANTTNITNNANFSNIPKITNIINTTVTDNNLGLTKITNCTNITNIVNIANISNITGTASIRKRG